MRTLNINIDDELQDFLTSQAARLGFSSADDYVQSLWAELKLRVSERKELEAKLLEGIRSPGVIADEAFWAERRRKIIERNPELADVS